MKKILEVPLEQDLKPLSVYWHQQSIRHRISEESGRQVIYVTDELQADKVQSDYASFSKGELNIQLKKVSRAAQSVAITDYFRLYPVTLSLIVLSVLGFLAVQLQLRGIVELLVIQSMDDTILPGVLNVSPRISTGEYLAHGQYWRLITPVFLHFGWLHIIFNMLWMWELGKRIEIQGGSLHLLAIVLVVGMASNLYQAEATPYAVFGGMSGVIYGLLGYCAMFNVIAPSRRLQLPAAIYVLMIASLLLGYSGIFDFLARMANTAHLSGLILGLVMGTFSALIYRYVPAR